MRRQGFTATITHSHTPPVLDVNVDIRGDGGLADIHFGEVESIVREFLVAHLQHHVMEHTIRDLAEKLRRTNNRLVAAICRADPNHLVTPSLALALSQQKESQHMATADSFAPLIAEVARTATVVGSAVVLMDGFGERVVAAVQAALAGGATAAEIVQVVTDEVAALKASNDALAASVAANTVAATEPPAA